MTLLQTKLNSKGGVTLDASEYVELQDDFGRMTIEQTGKLWATLAARQRDVFMFLAYRVLSTDVAIEMTKRLVLADTVAEEVNWRVGEIARQNKQLEAALFDAQATAEGLATELAQAKHMIENMSDALNQADTLIARQEAELVELREVAAALKTLRKFLA